MNKTTALLMYSIEYILTPFLSHDKYKTYPTNKQYAMVKLCFRTQLSTWLSLTAMEIKKKIYTFPFILHKEYFWLSMLIQYGDNFILYFRISTFALYKETLSYVLYSIEYLFFPYGYGKKYMHFHLCHIAIIFHVYTGKTFSLCFGTKIRKKMYISNMFDNIISIWII